jgi:hypothetical protein
MRDPAQARAVQLGRANGPPGGGEVVAFPHVRGVPKWVPGSVVVDGNLESDDPTWLMRARRGRQWVDLASGPLVTRAAAELVAGVLNDLDPERWNGFLERDLRHLLAGEWG